MACESSVGPEDWRSTVIVPLYKDKGERTEWKNYKSINLLSVVEYVESLWDSFRI